MKKSEAEVLARSAVHDWATETGFTVESAQMPSFLDFRDWLLERWPSALSFRSTMGPRDDAERWFDEKLKQTWRN